LKRRTLPDAKGHSRPVVRGGRDVPNALSLLPYPTARAARAVVVQKFGGTSVGSIDRIRSVAKRVVAAHQRGGRDVVVVVSAMSGETNRLIALAKEVAAVPDRAELDAIAASGEQVAAGLTALAITQEGVRARSFLGHQVRVLTDASYGDGRVLRVETAAIRACLDRGEIPVLAGFQGVDDSTGRIVTLGRGGSDTSAVVVAAALGATCEIYTDVDGVYSADPSSVPGARKLSRCSLDDMLVLASNGAKVLHPRSVAVAKAHGVPMYVRSSFASFDDEGTFITNDDDSNQRPLEGPTFVGIAQDRSIALVHLTARSDAEAMRVLSALASERIAIQMVTRGAAPGVLTFVAPEVEVERIFENISATGAVASAEKNVSAVTVVGSGLSAPRIVAHFLACVIREAGSAATFLADESKLQCVVDATLANALITALYADLFDQVDQDLRCSA